MAVSSHRLSVLDGLRGVAILLVVTFHYFGRFTDARGEGLYPYGDVFAGLPVARDGFVGVYLFFIISGFVIFRSLRQSEGPWQFARKRANRLFLPMLVISLATFLLLSTILVTPQFEVRPVDLLPSITFTPPLFWKWLDPGVSYVDGVYWTLFVEIRFYVLMAALWFLFRRFAVVGLVALAILAVALKAILGGWSLPNALLGLALFPEHISLFAAGVLYSELMEKDADRRIIFAGLAVVIPFTLVGVQWAPEAEGEVIPAMIWIAAFHLTFLSFALNARWVGVFAWRPLVWIGLISYSLYLLHQRIGVALITRMPEDWPLWAHLVGVLAIFGALAGAAWLSWRFIEQLKPFGSARPRAAATKPGVSSGAA